MTKDEYQKKAEAGEAVLVDIREPDELVAEPSPEGAINIPMSSLPQAEAAGKLPKDKLVVTLCRSGGRCQPVTAFLRGHGYQADFIEGGMMGW